MGWLEVFLVASAAIIAAVLTFFSGFGLGTLLLPVFAAFFPLETAVAATAVVHLVNNLGKAALMLPHVKWSVVLSFGLPAMFASLLGARLLLALAQLPEAIAYRFLGQEFHVTFLKLLVALLLAAFAIGEIVPWLDRSRLARRWLPLGGILSGFFGGLAGFQGAFRAAFLVRAGLSKEVFIATSVLVAILVDVSRLAIYGGALADARSGTLFSGAAELGLLGVAIAAALAGTLLGKRLLRKVTMLVVQRLVIVLLFTFSVLLALGGI